MAKKYIAAAIALALVPTFIAADYFSSVGNQIVGVPCMVRVYHTQFQLPPQGGQIVQIGDELFFWRSYLPHCGGAASSQPGQTAQAQLASQPTAAPAPASQAAANLIAANTSSSYPPQIVGVPCMVRVYHTQFQLPPQGGHIAQIGNELYFVRDYLPHCAGTAAVQPAQSSAYVPASSSYYQPVAVRAITQPAYAPVQTQAPAVTSYRFPTAGSPHASQIVGVPCMVRVYHTQFQLPPQGGFITQIGDELYFVRSYLPGCGNAGM